jgi:hypothetical protein
MAAPAAGHGDRHPYESEIGGIVPATAGAGIEVRILDHDSQVELTNRSGHRVIVKGYEGEPYARLESDGPVYVNLRSPSRPLSSDRFGRTPPTGREDASASPRWSLIGEDGRLAWYDRRAHYRRRGVPDQVDDPAKRTRIRDYWIPILVGGIPARIEGSLYWTGKKGFPTGPFLALLTITGLCGLFGARMLGRLRSPGSESPGGELPQVEE